MFRDGFDVLVARQLVGEKLSQLSGRLPREVRAPVMAPLTSSSGIVLRIGLTGSGLSPMELRALADGTMRPRLLAVPGVAAITVFGGEVRQYQVQVRNDRLAAHGVTLEKLLQSVREAYGVVGAGFFDNANQRITVRAEAALRSPADLANTVVAVREGLPIPLAQLADVAIGPEPKFGDATILGTPAVLLAVYKQLDANSLAVTRAVEVELEVLRRGLPAGVRLHPALFRQANLIERSLRGVSTALILGGAMVILVLIGFLSNFRTALISLTAIPLSLLGALGVLVAFGQTINVLTLGGLAIAIGEVVDDAIIDVENIYRRLRENQSSPRPQPALAVVLAASLEVRGAVVFATFVVALVFLPVLCLSGLQGSLFAPLAKAYILSILVSLLVALTVTPAMAAVMLSGRRLPPQETRLLGWSKDAYQRLLHATIGHPWAVGLGAAALCAAGLAVLPLLGGEFMPELNEGTYSIHMAGLPGTSLQESLRVGARVQKTLAALPVVRQVCQQAGRAELSEDIWGTNYSEIHVDMQPVEGADAEQAREQLRDAILPFPGYYFSIKPFLTERIEELLSGTTAEVAVRVFGPDLDTLDRLADDVARVLRSVPGATDVMAEQQAGTPELRWIVDRQQCDRQGVRPGQVLDVLQSILQGVVVGQVYESGRPVDLVVRLSAGHGLGQRGLEGIFVDGAHGRRVPLVQLVRSVAGDGRSLIGHDGTSRRALVQCNVRGRDVSSFVDDARTTLERQLKLPKDYFLEFGGEAQAARAARDELLLFSALAIVAVCVLLYAAVGSWRLLVLLLANLPFAMVGGVAALLTGGAVVSIGAMIGFVTLFGISIRNSIMLVSHYQHLVEEEGRTWDSATAIQGALERLGPILMTALVTALGLFPMAIGGPGAGREIEQPMAVVILGGLITSTLLNLLVLPTLVRHFGRLEARTSPV